MSPRQAAPPLLLLLAAAVPAQQPVQPDVPPALRELAAELEPLTEAETLRTPGIDAPSLAAAEAAASVSSASTAGGIAPLRFAEPFTVDATPADLGEWRTSLDGGTRVWRLRIVSEGAVSLNLGFTRYRMPPGGRLYVYTPGFADVIGPFTAEDNESHGQLWTPILPGGEAVVVVSAPVDRAGDVELELGSVNRGFRDPESVASGSHAGCNINVACSEADPYRDQVRSVGWYSIGGYDICSGSLLNNTAGDGKPYFLTAWHCFFPFLLYGFTYEEIAASVVAYWNDEATACSGSTPRFDPRQSQSGTSHVSRDVGVDAILLEFDDPLDLSHNLYLAGWDRGLPTTGPVVGIHHPATHFKSISISTGTPRERDDYLRVVWKHGVTEGGSSGSPLFNARKRVVGPLSSGESSCSTRNSPDWYGHLGSAWSRFSAALDPAGADPTGIDGQGAYMAVSPMNLKLLEDSSTTYTVVPVWEPNADVVVSISVPGGTDLSASPTSLTFTTENWETEQTVTVTAADDADNLRDDPVTIGHSAAGGGYDAVTLDDVVAVIGENDPGVEVSLSSLPVGQCGSEVYTVGLVSAPTADAVLSVSLPADPPVSVSPSSLTFTTENWETVRTVTVTAADDADLAAAPSVAIAHSASGGGYGEVSIAGVTVSARTTRAAVSVRPGSLTVDENGSAEYTVSMDSSAAVDAVVSVTTPVLDHVRHIRTSRSSLTFTPENWSAPRTVKVTARDDADAVPLPTLTISHSVSGCGFTSARAPNLPVTVVENDVAGVTVKPQSLRVAEGGTARYTVRPTSQPTSTVRGGVMTLRVEVPDGLDVSVDDTSVTWNWTWNRTKTVTVTAAEDLDPDSDAPVVISHRARGGDYSSVSVPSVTVTIVEDDASALSAVDVSGSEADGDLEFEVAISLAGASDVLVDYATSDGTARAGSDYTSTSGTLTFPKGTTTSQTVRVPLLNDADDETDEETFTLTLSNVRNGHLAGGGSELRVTGTIEDDEDTPVTASFRRSSYAVTEGSSVLVEVRLDRDSGRTLTLPLEPTPRGGVSPADYSGLPLEVTFGPRRRTAEFRFSATDDDDDDDGEAVELSFGAPLPPQVTAGRSTVLAINDNDGGGTPPGGPGGPGGPPPPPPDDDDDDDEDDGGGGGGGGFTPPRAAIRTDAECSDGLCRAVTGAPVRFEDASTGSVQRRSWDFGEGSSRSAAVNWSWSEPGFHEVTLEVSGGDRESADSLVFLVEASDPAGTCVAGAETLCLQDSRFSVEAEWWTASGVRGAGRVVRRGTNDSGLFSFFGGGNWEMLVKVLDGCALNGHVWVFGALTTDLGYRIAVTDTVTGASKEYRNEPGAPAAAVTDATAFPGGCPAKRP